MTMRGGHAQGVGWGVGVEVKKRAKSLEPPEECFSVA